MQVSTAPASSSAWLRKRPSQNRPVQPSSRLAWRAIHSFKQRIYQLTFHSRSRHTAIRCARAAAASPSSLPTLSGKTRP